MPRDQTRARDSVFVTRRLPGTALERLAGFVDLDCWPGEGPPPREALLEHAADKEGLLTMLTDQVDAELVGACPRLRVVSNMAVGHDNVELAALEARDIVLGYTPDVLTEATADLTFALLLGLARRLFEARAALLEGRWRTWDPSGFLGLELDGARLGILGMGRIGTAVARRALGFGLEVVAWSRSKPALFGVTYLDLDEVLRTSDVVTVHVALNPATHHLLSERELSQMQPGALLINTSRGPVVDEDALYRALSSGRLGGAGLDVFETEPVPPKDRLVNLDNVLGLPHIGSATRKTRAAMADLAVDNLLAGLSGEAMTACANREVEARLLAHQGGYRPPFGDRLEP